MAYLLGLEWRYVRDLTKIGEETKTFEAMEYATSENLLPGTLGNESDLLLARAQVSRRVDEVNGRVQGFQVIDDLDRLLQRADDLTEQLRDLRNESLLDRRLLELYRSSIQESDASDAGDLQDQWGSGRSR